VLADRLSESSDVSVLVVEAGGSDLDPRVLLPIGLFRLPSSLDWNYEGDPDESLGGRVDRWAAGKVIGGGSSVNGMLWVRGARADFDEWQELGATGWSYEGVLPYFRRAETYASGEDEFRGGSGPQHISPSRVSHPLNEAFLTAAAQAGVAFNPDYNGRGQLGAAHAQVSQWRGLRWSTARGYLARAARRPNVTVMTRTQVCRVVIDHDRAVGVEIEHDGRPVTLRADREVVVSAGAIGSPTLLMRSGVGPAEHLRSVGIDPVADLPELGANLQEHPCSAITYDVNVRTLNQEFGPAGFVKHGLDFVLRGRGGATSTAAQAVLFDTLDDAPGGEGGRAEYQVMFGPYGVTPSTPKSGGKARDPRNVDLASTPVVRALVCLLHPRGRGSVTVRSSDLSDRPRIRRALYGDEHDLDHMVRVLRRTREVLSAPAFAKYVVRETLPGPAVGTDQELAAYLGKVSYGGQHPVGTCRMGEDPGAPVDPQLRVRHLEHLRVVDASVMPTLVSGNTNAATIMIAERAADLILAP
jgi:choline dehydrogenase